MLGIPAYNILSISIDQKQKKQKNRKIFEAEKKYFDRPAEAEPKNSTCLSKELCNEYLRDCH